MTGIIFMLIVALVMIGLLIYEGITTYKASNSTNYQTSHSASLTNDSAIKQADDVVLNNDTALLTMQGIEEYQNSATMTHAFHTGVTAAVKNIYNFGGTILRTPDLYNILGSDAIELNIGDGVITEPQRKCYTLIWTDLILGHLLMGHPMQTEKAQGFGLFQYFYIMQINKDGVPYKGLRFMTHEMTDPCNNVSNYIAKALQPYMQQSHSFQTLKLLKNHPEMVEQFKVLMYRYFSLVSKADGKVTEQESKFLADIMKMEATSKTEGNMKAQQKDALAEESSSNAKSEKKEQKSEKPMEELKSLIGLDSVKSEIETLTNFIKIQKTREKKGLKNSSVSYHCVFTGNPGTGKTTVARIVAGIYRDMGILKKGHLVETDRSGLVAEYVGQTAVKTNKIIDSAIDGVLFIDEAYSLVNESKEDFGKEAIATLLKRMEDDRDRLVVILAGYTNEIKQFIDSNPGLQSRFNRYIEFPDYTAGELFRIFELSVKKYDYVMPDDTKAALHAYLEDAVAHKDKNFGNGRFVRNIFEKTLERQADRLASVGKLDQDTLMQILPEDLPIL